MLFNGGLFASALMRGRLLEIVRGWFSNEDWTPLVLRNERLDLAVALGAAYYGMVRRGEGVKISGGLARSYYIGLAHESEELALCLAPAGLEEGQNIVLNNRKFDLVVRRPAEFPLYVSSVRTSDRAGDLVAVDPVQLSALPPIRTVLRTRREADADAGGGVARAHHRDRHARTLVRGGGWKGKLAAAIRRARRDPQRRRAARCGR